MTGLIWANASLLALQVAHTLDHIVNQPNRDYAAEVVIPGPLGILTSAGVLYLAWRHRPEAGPLSIFIGLSVTFGFVAVHLLPHWSAFSDRYADVNVDGLSWVLLVLPMAAGLWTAFEGARAMRARRARPVQA